MLQLSDGSNLSRAIWLALGLAKTMAALYRTGRVAPVYGAPNCAQDRLS